ncbi:hypothetical protein ACFY2R_09550 [Micromonospora olivasterospora]|uniref:Uncharacterized protein n=1 Tax=Micromonospora olivasterospora TaxID=1880 RepID=A0A562I7I5_MICOL|nr:hypothetical protein [Micromonospora olivasterospora]TWH66685.1 hypothetical protein JD77_01643 [Micromonospora olivasterospora]
MTRTITRRLVAGFLGAGLGLLGAAPAAQATAPGDTSVSVGRLVLDPTDRGYAGRLPVTVTYRGSAAADLELTVTEPVPGAFAGLTPTGMCFTGSPTPVRKIYCTVPGGALQPGERRRFTVDFRVLTSPRAHAMSATGGRVTVGAANGTPADDASDFPTLFRSTTGSLDDPRPYVWDTLTDASLAVGSAVLARQGDGTWLGRLPVTVRAAGDAAHDAWLEPTLPAGVSLAGIEPTAVCGSSCEVAGGRFMEGEERTVALLLRAPAEVTPGDLGTGSVRLVATFGWGDELVDVDPADNTAAFGVTAVPAG